MLPKTYLQKLAAAVAKRSGISKATVEVVLPATFDEIRAILTEGTYPCIPIESFGTFAVIDRPEHEYLNTYKGKHEVVTIPARKQLKFKPTASMKREVESGRFDPTRKSFSRHPDDRPIRKRKDMRYQKNRGFTSARPIYKEK